MRTISFKYKVIRNGGEMGYIFPAAGSAPVIQMNDSAEIKTSLRGVFAAQALDVDGNAITPNWLTDELQPVLEIDGVPSPLGVFLPATVTPEERSGIQTLSIEAYDRAWRIQDVTSEGSLYFAAGTNYLDAVVQLLTAAGIALVVKTPSAATLTEARQDWDIGTNYLKIVNELLGEINYNPVWFNERGAAVLEPASVPTAENIEHTLDASNVESLLLPQISRTTDVYRAPNVFLCVCSNADKSGPLVATAENTNPQSPLSIMRRGRQIMSVKRVNNIASQAELQAYADRLRNESMLTGETIRVTTALLPGFGVADVTAIHYGELSAVCVERAWSMELTVGGSMQHTLERVVAQIG